MKKNKLKIEARDTGAPPADQQGQMLELAGLAAQIILENGAETYRVEDTVVRLCRSYGFSNADAIALSTGVLISVGVPGSHQAILRRVRKRGLNLIRVNAVNDLSRRIAAGGIPMETAMDLLQKIAETETVPPVCTAAMAGLSAGFFALMFGGGPMEFCVALICGALTQALAYGFQRADFSLVLSSLTGSLLSSLVTMGAFYAVGLTPAGVETALAGAIMPLISGLMMTNAVRDSLRGDLLSGLARGAEALLVAILVALGISVVLRFYLPGQADMAFAQPPPWYFAVLFAGLATLFFCPLIKVPWRAILPASLLGAAVYGGYLLLTDFLGVGSTFSMFAASAVIGILCDLLARRMRMVATIFLCATLVPLVPGLGLYRTMRALLLDHYESALILGTNTLLAVGAIALGAAIGSLRLMRPERGDRMRKG